MGCNCSVLLLYLVRLDIGSLSSTELVFMFYFLELCVMFAAVHPWKLWPVGFCSHPWKWVSCISLALFFLVQGGLLMFYFGVQLGSEIGRAQLYVMYS